MGEDSTRNSPPPAPWEVGFHDPEQDRMEQEQEHQDFLSVYKNMKRSEGDGEDGITFQPPLSVLRLMEFPKSTPQHASPSPLPTSAKQLDNKNVIVPPVLYQEDKVHIDQLQRESATLLATYQHSDLEGVKKVERNMVEITQLLSQFTDLITEQQEDIFLIHDQAIKSKENVEKGQDQLVDATSRGEKSRHPMASFIVAMALLLLFFNWITP